MFELGIWVVASAIIAMLAICSTAILIENRSLSRRNTDLELSLHRANLTVLEMKENQASKWYSKWNEQTLRVEELETQVDEMKSYVAKVQQWIKASPVMKQE